MTAEGLSTRTVKDRAWTLGKLERDLGTPALAADTMAIAQWLGRRDDDLAQVTRSVYHSHLVAFYRYCVTMGLREDNPMTRIKAARRPRRTPRPIAVEDYEKCRDAADLPTRAMLMLITLAGLRDAEIARFHSNMIDVRARLIEVPGKGGRIDVLPAHPDLVFIARRMPRGFWFPSQRKDRRHIGGRTVWQQLRLHMLACDVMGKPHQFRHTYGSELVAAGTDLRTVQSLMRHADLSTTAIYTALPDGAARNGIDSLPTSQAALPNPPTPTEAAH